MALTRDFILTVRARAQRDVAFRVGLLKEAIECFLEGEVEAGKLLLREYINATIGFEKLAQKMGTPSKSLHRMLADRGNPSANTLFKILAELQKSERVAPDVRLRDAA